MAKHVDNRPNIILFITDQMRGDCLSIDGHPVIQTPYIDQEAGQGIHFKHGYTECPVCVPARRSLMTGQRPATQGVTMNYDTWLHGPTLPEELAKAGYQTHLVGKLHLWPKRKRYGFESEDWADSPVQADTDYDKWLNEQGLTMPNPGMAHGANQNGWVSRPFHLEERYHFTNWCADKAMEFIGRRDPTRPFFLKVSFHQPHEPCTPPQMYWDRYMNMDLGEPWEGDWSHYYDEVPKGQGVCSWRTLLSPAQLKQYRAGYYGCINHIDDQIGRIMCWVPRNTIFIFTSDHGEMLGDHQWIRKRNAFEPSARIPYVIRFPEEMGIPQKRVCEAPVQLMDLMPTLLDAAGAAIPESVDGQSLLPYLRGEAQWREYVHGECADVPSMDSGMQYVTNGKQKYIWFPGPGEELYFDLEKDPKELHNLAQDADRQDEIAIWRQRLIQELAGRPEGFVKDGKLVALGSNTPFCLPGYEKENFV